MIIATTELLELFKVIVPKGTKEKVQYCKTINKLTNVLSEYQAPQRVNTQGHPRQRVAPIPTDSHGPTLRKVIRTTS